MNIKKLTTGVMLLLGLLAQGHADINIKKIQKASREKIDILYQSLVQLSDSQDRRELIELMYPHIIMADLAEAVNATDVMAAICQFTLS
jgi:hypothetical protein